MLTENDVVEAVAKYLRGLGYHIESICTTTQKGCDLVAASPSRGRIRIEAKGGTSSKGHTARFGKPFNSNQALSHVSRAFYKAVEMYGQYPEDQIALALPDDDIHRVRVDAISKAIRCLGINVFLVDGTHAVRLYG